MAPQDDPSIVEHPDADGLGTSCYTSVKFGLTKGHGSHSHGPHEKGGVHGASSYIGSCYVAAGRVRRKRAPRGELSTVAEPPWAVAASRTMASPSPAPGFERAVADR